MVSMGAGNANVPVDMRMHGQSRAVHGFFIGIFILMPTRTSALLRK